MKNINIIHMQSGEQLIGNCKELAESIEVKNPAILVPAGQGKIGLAPYAPYIEGDTLNIGKHVVSWMAEAENELGNQYNAAFGNGLVQVPAEVNTAIPNLKMTD